MIVAVGYCLCLASFGHILIVLEVPQCWLQVPCGRMHATTELAPNNIGVIVFCMFAGAIFCCLTISCEEMTRNIYLSSTILLTESTQLVLSLLASRYLSDQHHVQLNTSDRVQKKTRRVLCLPRNRR